MGRYYNSRVTQVSKAKDFLVNQTAIQAALDGVSLSDIEKRMMYFTEGLDSTEDPIALNDEFEAEYEMATYEAKMSKLLHRAYARVKKENPETARTWNESIRILKKGDHYILVLWGVLRLPYDSLKLLATAFLVVALLLGIIVTAENYHFHWNPASQSHGPTPVWLGRWLLFMMATGYAYYAVFPWISKKSPLSPTELFLRLFRSSSDKTSDQHKGKFNQES